MKQLAFVVIILLIPLSVGQVRAQLAEATPTPAPVAETAEIMGENDRLPFMQNQPERVVDETSSSGLLLKTLGAMLVIVGLIFSGAWIARKMGFANIPAAEQDPDHALAVITTIALGTGKSVSTVRFGDRVLLVGSTPQSVSLLAETPADAGQSKQVRRSVAEMLVEEDEEFAVELDLAEERIAAAQGGTAS